MNGLQTLKRKELGCANPSNYTLIEQIYQRCNNWWKIWASIPLPQRCNSFIDNESTRNRTYTVVSLSSQSTNLFAAIILALQNVVNSRRRGKGRGEKRKER